MATLMRSLFRMGKSTDKPPSGDLQSFHAVKVVDDSQLAQGARGG